MFERPDLVARLLARYDQCFACGRANSIGLHLDGFRTDGADIVADFEPRAEHRSTPGALHGGITATLLDEILAWAAILQEGTLAVTATLELRFHQPAPLAGPYRLAGRVEDRSGRRLRITGEMRNCDGILASGRGAYIATTPVTDLLDADAAGELRERPAP